MAARHLGDAGTDRDDPDRRSHAASVEVSDVPADLIAQAAQILGVDTSAASQDQPNLVVVTVSGPEARKVVQVPTDVPAGALAATLGASVGVKIVARLSVRGSDVILPTQTLGEVGVRAGSVIVVDEPGAPGLAGPAPSLGASGQRCWPTAGPLRREPWHRARTNRQWAMLAASVAAMVATVVLVGATVFGSGPPDASTGSSPLAWRAAQTWLADTSFAGPRMAAVPANLGRGGPKLVASLEPAGSSTSAGITSQQFIVAPRTGSEPAFGLSVVAYHGKIAYPPTITGLPFAEPPSATVPETGTIVAPTATKTAARWAQATFGPNAAGPVTKLGYRLAGKVKVLSEWRPKTGAALVARVEVPLSTSAAGTPAAQARLQAGKALAASYSTVAADRKAVSSASATVATEQTAVSKAGSAAQAAVTTASGANQPASTTRAVTAAQQAATKANQTLNSDRRTLETARDTLAAAEGTEATDAAALAKAVYVSSATLVSVYDVAFSPAGRPLAWAPADYLIGHS